ncbi:MAG: DUF2066 domain-containing protein, partial [Cellvibrionaceae bacterium]|nr:DUF2066 domain-containing protein [Cellvibrionaceae bacterium]
MNTAPRTHALPFFILLVGLLGLSSHGLAAKVDNLYRASFPVEKQDGAEREQLAAAGLARVLVKVSGRRNLPREGQLGEALQRANRYLQQFSYSGAEQGFILHLDYAKGAVDNLLRKSALPIWPDNRPQILLWLVQDNSQQ